MTWALLHSSVSASALQAGSALEAVSVTLATQGTPALGDVPATGFAFNAQEQMYVSGHYGVLGSPYLIKYDVDGTLLWQRYYDTAAYNGSYIGEQLEIDSQGNIFMYAYSNNGSPDGTILFKIDPDGTLLWQRFIAGDVVQSAEAMQAMAVGTDDSLIFAGRGRANNSRVSPDSFSGQDLIIGKFDSNGNEVFITGYYLSTAQDSGWAVGGVTVDSQNNIYVCGEVNNSGGTNPESDIYGAVIKFNPTGTGIIWEQYSLDSSTNHAFWSDIGVSSDDANLYLVERSGDNLFQGMIKLSAADGTLIWHNNIRTLTPDLETHQITQVYVDPVTENVYTLGYVNDLNDTNRQDLTINQYDPVAGAHVWGKTIGQQNANDFTWWSWSRGNLKATDTKIGTAGFSFRTGDADGFAIVLNKDGSDVPQAINNPAIPGSYFLGNVSFDPQLQIQQFVIATAGEFDSQYSAWYTLGVIETNHRLSGTVVNALTVPNTFASTSAGKILTGDAISTNANDFLSYTLQPDYNTATVADLAATDAAGNVYTGANSTVTGVRDMSLTKHAADGTLLWQYYYPHISGAAAAPDPYLARFSDIKCDAAGNVFAAISDPGANGTGEYRLTLIKFNSDGDILWQRTIADLPTAESYYFGSMTVDNSGNAFVMFSGRLSTTAVIPPFNRPPDPDALCAYIAKYDGSGTLVWEKGFCQDQEEGSNYQMRSDMITDSTGDVYCQWMIWDKESIATVKLAAADGSVLWDVYRSAWDQSNGGPYLSGFAEVQALGISSDGSTLMQGYSFSTLHDRPSIIVKINAATGAIIDNRQIIYDGGDEFSQIYDIKIDPATDLVYVFGAIDKASARQRPALIVMDLNYNIQFYHEYIISPLGYSNHVIDYNEDTFTNRGPRIAIGTDNIAIRYLHDDTTSVNSVLMNFKKDGTSLSEGTLYTNARGTIYSLFTSGPITISAFTPLMSDQWFDANGDETQSGTIIDITADLEVTDSNAATYGTKSTSGALPVPVLESL